MNHDGFEHIKKAQQYKKAVLKTILPERMYEHVNTIGNELQEMFDEIIHKKDKNPSDEQRSSATKRDEKVKKVTIV